DSDVPPHAVSPTAARQARHASRAAVTAQLQSSSKRARAASSARSCASSVNEWTRPLRYMKLLKADCWSLDSRSYGIKWPLASKNLAPRRRCSVGDPPGMPWNDSPSSRWTSVLLPSFPLSNIRTTTPALARSSSRPWHVPRAFLSDSPPQPAATAASAIKTTTALLPNIGEPVLDRLQRVGDGVTNGVHVLARVDVSMTARILRLIEVHPPVVLLPEVRVLDVGVVHE